MICNDCVIEALHGWVEESPRPGHLRLAQPTNRVWLAIEELGGVLVAAQRLGYPPEEIDRWIDEHHIPYGPGEEVARLSSYSLKDLQVPLMWVEDEGRYWPQSAYLASRAQETEGLLKPIPSWPAIHTTSPSESSMSHEENFDIHIVVPQEVLDAIPISPECLKYRAAFGLDDDLPAVEFDSECETLEYDPEEDYNSDSDDRDPPCWRPYEPW